MPQASERAEAKQVHKRQFEDAPPAPDSAGAVQQPMEEGTEVYGGRLEVGL